MNDLMTEHNLSLGEDKEVNRARVSLTKPSKSSRANHSDTFAIPA